MPGPMVPSPAPTPSEIDLIALAVSASAKSVMTEAMGSSLVALGGRRSAEIDGCKRCEDECLQGRDQHDLEEVERHGDRRRGHQAESRDAEKDREPPCHEEDQQVAGEDVGEQPDRQRDDPDKVGYELDHED